MSDIPYIQQAQEVKITGQDSGGTTVNYVSADANGNLLVKDYSDGPVTPGTVASVSQLGGSQYNTTLPAPTNTQQTALQSDLNGRLLVASAPLDGYKATYSASITELVAANTPTDIFTITGSATKTVRITRIGFSGTQNTSATRDILLIKRSAANTGGTSTNPTLVPLDSNDAAATVTINAYTVNPSALGATVGTIRSQRYQLLATNVTTPIDRIFWEFGNRPAQALVLRGTSQVLAINLNSVTSSSNSFNIDIEWTEE